MLPQYVLCLYEGKFSGWCWIFFFFFLNGWGTSASQASAAA